MDDRSVGNLPAVQGGVGQLGRLCIVCLHYSLIRKVVASKHCCWDGDERLLSATAPGHTPDGVWCNKKMKWPARAREKTFCPLYLDIATHIAFPISEKDGFFIAEQELVTLQPEEIINYQLLT